MHSMMESSGMMNTFSPDPDQHALDDGEGEGQLDPERGPDVLPGLHLHRSAQRFDVGLHHVHADAAAGKIAGGRRGREAGCEEERVEDIVAHLLPVLQEAERNGLFPDLVPVEPPAVVRHLDENVPLLVVGVQPDPSLALLAEVQALGRHLDAVVHGVAYHVLQRVAYLLDHRLVKLGLVAEYLQAYLLTVVPRRVADEPPELREGRPDRDHPDRHDLLLELPGWSGRGRRGRS